MRFLRIALVFAPLFALTGCGYIHFGRLPDAATSMGDSALATAYTNLGTEHKILQQELALARKEGAALRTALENRSPDGAASPELAARLNDANRELAALRASYARLQNERAPAAGAASDPATQAKLTDLEEKLASSLRGYTQLQEDNARLRTEVDRTRADNTALAAQVKSLGAENAAAQAALAQLNLDLLAQKDARARAEQQTAAAHAQLGAILAQRSAPAPTLAGARESSADSVATLRLAQTPPVESVATAELRTSPDRVRATAASAPAPAPVPDSASTKGTAPVPRIHIVVVGDTLERIAKKYYGNPDRWRTIYSANNDLLSGGRPLKPGMALEIPEE